MSTHANNLLRASSHIEHLYMQIESLCDCALPLTRELEQLQVTHGESLANDYQASVIFTVGDLKVARSRLASALRLIEAR